MHPTALVPLSTYARFVVVDEALQAQAALSRAHLVGGCVILLGVEAIEIPRVHDPEETPGNILRNSDLTSR
jgi:hypothetical protein